MTPCIYRYICKVGKEKLSYRKEADMQKAKLSKMKEDGKDEHDVKKMGEVAPMLFLAFKLLTTRCCKRP